MNRYRSFFWPGVLILAGVIALLVNTGVVPAERLWELINLWPLILIVIGLELVVRRMLHGPTGDVATGLVVLVAVVAAAAYVTYAPNPVGTGSRDFSGDVGGVSRATVEVDVGAATIAIAGAGDLGSKLYRGHIDYSGAAPEVSFDQEGAVLKIHQPNGNFFGPSRKFELSLELNPAVAWTIDERSGATEDTLQLGSVNVSAITLHTGASRDDITLGPPKGPVQVQVNGGALTVHVHRTTGTKVSVDVSGGAVTLVADGKDLHAIGKVSYATGDLGSDYYRIHVSGGACTVSLDATAPSD